MLALHPGPATPGPSAAPSLALVGVPVLVTRQPSIVNAVAFSPDGRTVASADNQSVLRLSALDGTHSVPDVAHSGPINTLVWHPDGHSLFSAGYDGVIRQWDPHGQQLTSWAAHHAPVKSLAWSSPTALLVAGSSDATLSARLPGAAGSSPRPRRAGLAGGSAGHGLGQRGDRRCHQGDRVRLPRPARVPLDATTGALIIESLPQAHTKSHQGRGHVPRRRSAAHRRLRRQRSAVATRPRGVALASLGPPRQAGGPGGRPRRGGALTAGWKGSVAQWSPTGELLHALALSAAADPPGAGA